MEDLIIGADEALVFPSGNGIDQPIVFDLRSVFRAERRLVDLQNVTRLKAGELLHCFIEAWKDARTFQARARKQLVVAKRRIKEVRAEIILDRALDILKAKQLTTSRSPSGSEDLRDSVVTRDPDYRKTVERMEQIEAVVELLEIKAEVFKMAYFSVNKLIDPLDRTTSSTSGGTGTDDVGALTDDERVQEFVQKQQKVNTKSYAGSGFGAPKL